jgi:integrase
MATSWKNGIRQNGDGTWSARAENGWRTREDGTRWRDRPVLGPFPTKAKARQALQDHAAKLRSPDYIAPHALTCGEWRESYVRSKVDAGKARSYTRDLESTLRVWWSEFDSVPLQELQDSHLEDMKRRLAAKRVQRGAETVGLSHRQRQKVWNATAACLRSAVRRKKIAWNPADACDPPAAPAFDPDASEDLREWEPAVVEAFTDYVSPADATTDDEFAMRTAVCLNFELGLRPGELAALRWADRTGDAVRIRRSNSMVGGLGETDLKDVKTGHGRRDVGMSARAVSLWNGLQARQRVVGLDGFLFSPTGPCHPQRIIDCFEQLRDGFLANNPGVDRITFYGTRHSAISRWVRKGVSPEMVHKMAGHGSYGFTIKRYFRPTRTDAEEAARKLG